MEFPRGLARLAICLSLLCACRGGGSAPPVDDEGGRGGEEQEGGAGADGNGGEAGQGGAPANSTGGRGASVDASAPEDVREPGPDAGSTQPRRSAGCGKAGTGTGSYARQTVAIAGTQRTFFVWVPQGYDSERAYPVLFQFHGTGGVAPGNGRGVELKAGGEAILVSPQGIDGLWQLGAEGVDVAFFDAMLKDITSNRCVDERRIFAMGFSRGGAMSNLLGCVRGNVIRAIGPLAGWQPSRQEDCVGHTAAWFAHGKSDAVVPIGQGTRARDLLATRNGCSDANAMVSPPPCVEYAGCGHATKLVWCETAGGHGEVIEYSAPVIWDFFKRFD